MIRKTLGFTLVEVMIVAAIIAILAAIAFPLLNGYMERARRAEAVQLLGEMQLRMERWRADNPSYDFSDNAAAFGALPTATYYQVEVVEADVSSYTLEATGIGAQANDSECATMIIVMENGVETRKPSADESRCWN